MKGLPNFILDFERIRNYLAKAPNASQQELDAAKEAFNTIVLTIYAGSAPIRCDHTHPTIPTL